MEGPPPDSIVRLRAIKRIRPADRGWRSIMKTVASSAPETRRLLARRIAVDSFVLLIASFAIESHVFLFGGIALPVAQVGGGPILIATGWGDAEQKKARSAVRKR